MAKTIYSYTSVLDTADKSPAAEGWYVKTESGAYERTADTTPVEGREYYISYIDNNPTTDTTMAYEMVTVKKKGTSPGMPTGKKVYVLIFDMDNVSMARDEKGVKITSFALVDSTKKPVGIFVDQATLDAGDQVEGDAGSRGFQHHVNFQHPGTELEIVEFKANNVNANLGAIVIPCDSANTEVKVYGTPCAPLTMQTATEEDTNEAHRNTFELQTAMRTWPVGIMAKSLVPPSDDATVNALLGLTGGNE